MPAASGFDVRRLASTETGLLVQLRAVFREAFEDDETYGGDPPAPGYLEELLSGDSFIAIVAVDGARVVGGIAAYELRKLERRRSEIYLYDLAVLSSYRRQG